MTESVAPTGDGAAAMPSSRVGPDTWRHSTGFAPRPAEHHGAVVQAYAAPVWGLRGLVADHTWIAVKPAGAGDYQRYEIVAWGTSRNRSAVSITTALPDGAWFGRRPRLLVDHRDAAADAIIPRILAASEAYPWAHRYVMWPGPNSNTYTQWIALAVPELGLRLSSRALGRNWMLRRRGRVAALDSATP